MKLGRRALARLAVAALLAGALVTLDSGSAHAALTPRNCRTTITGDGVRRLDVCARGWVNSGPTVTRGVVEMHTYRLVASGWVDTGSQTITINDAVVRRADSGTWVARFGQNISGTSCRIDGPSGPVGCLVRNDVRVAFYSAQISAPNFNPFQTVVYTASWRDDRGIPHVVNYNPPLGSPVWSA
jgi:hypothetical protein